MVKLCTVATTTATFAATWPWRLALGRCLFVCFFVTGLFAMWLGTSFAVDPPTIHTDDARQVSFDQDSGTN